MDMKKTTAFKVGEGSRGGKIMGHTKSGKPIYQSPFISRNYNNGGHGKVIVAGQQASKSFDDYVVDCLTKGLK